MKLFFIINGDAVYGTILVFNIIFILLTIQCTNCFTSYYSTVSLPKVTGRCLCG